MSAEPIVKPAPKPRTPMSEEAKERARLWAGDWYVEKVHIKDDAWSRKNPERALAIIKRGIAKRRDNAILAAPVIHDADRFERIQEVMASYKERKGEQK